MKGFVAQERLKEGVTQRPLITTLARPMTCGTMTTGVFTEVTIVPGLSRHGIAGAIKRHASGSSPVSTHGPLTAAREYFFVYDSARGAGPVLDGVYEGHAALTDSRAYRHAAPTICSMPYVFSRRSTAEGRYWYLRARVLPRDWSVYFCCCSRG